MKKVLLLLWKVLLTSLGGMETLRQLKQERRRKAGLPDCAEDTLTVSRNMRAASPPASAADILEATNNRRNNRPGIKRSMMTKQNSLDDVGLDLEGEEGEEDFEDASSGNASGAGSSSSGGEEGDSGNASEDSSGQPRVDSPRPGTPIPEKGKSIYYFSLKGLLHGFLSLYIQKRKSLAAYPGHPKFVRRIWTTSSTTPG